MTSPAACPTSGSLPHGMEWGTRQDLKTAPADMLIEYAQRYTDLIAMMAQDCGFDGAFLHMAYRMMPLGRFLSPLTNKRTRPVRRQPGKQYALSAAGRRSDQAKMRQKISSLRPPSAAATRRMNPAA